MNRTANMPINLRLFGSIHVERDNKPISVGARKAEALLAYLGMATQPQSREKLATLLWPSYGQSEALGHLRRELLRLRQTIGKEHFIADRKEINHLASAAWSIDAIRFTQLITEASTCDQPASRGCTTCLETLAAAVALYQEDFLAGFTLADAPEFDEWQYYQATDYRQTLARILGQLIQGHAANRNFDPAIVFGRRLVALDPLDEANQRQLMRLYAHAGQHAAAQRQYESLVATYKTEFDAPPSAETTALAESIRTRAFPSNAAEPLVPTLTQSPTHPAISPTPPPVPTLPSPAGTFVGRTAELNHFGQMLEQHNLAIISGMAGIGKSQLALALAHQVAEPERTFWHTFHENEGIESVIWRVAAFLAWHEQDDVWRMLENSQQTGAQLPPLSTLVDYLTQTMRGKRYLLCIDDLHHVEDDPAAAEPILKLTQMVQDGDISVIITSRRMPAFAQWIPDNQLHGLSLDDTTALLNSRGMELAHDYVRQLHENTGGNAQFLNLIIQALRKSRNPQRLVNNLLDADDLERWLLNEVNSQLSPEEQAVMNACSAMMGYPGTRGAIEAMLEGQRVRTPLRTLTDAHLLNFSERAEEREYHLHAIIGDFYYEGLSRKERDGLHQRAGGYYEEEEVDVFRAALHYERAGEVEKVGELVSEGIQTLVNQGHIRPIRHLLERIDENQLPQIAWAKVCVALGQAYALLGERALAYQRYERAQELCHALPNTQVLAAQCCMGMASLAEQESFEEALKWLQQGLEELEDRDLILAAGLYIRMAGIWGILGNIDAGSKAIELGQQRLPDEFHTLHIAALENAGALHFYQGRYSEATEKWADGLTLCYQQSNPFTAVSLLNNLGACNMVSGQWAEAQNSLEQGLHECKQLGTVHHLAMFHLNLGILHTWQNNDHEAEFHLNSIPSDQSEYANNGLYSLADLRIRQNKNGEAERLLKEAESKILETNSHFQLPELYFLFAQMKVASDQPAAALIHAEKALRMAKEMKMSREEGLAYMVLGQIHGVLENEDDAFAAFELALELFDDNSHYDSARTKLALGAWLFRSESTERALSILQEAHATFAHLGAKRDLAKAEQLLQSK